MERKRSTRRLSATLTGAGVMILFSGSGCLTGPDFLQSAVPAVHSGVSTILNGLLDGVFAAIQPDGAGDDTSTTSGDPSSNTAG